MAEYIQNPADLFGMNPDGKAQRLKCDTYGSLAVVHPEHYWIHQGLSFEASILWGDGNEIADNAYVDILIQAAAGMHSIWSVSAGGNCEVYFYRSPTFSSQGTVISSFNKNEYSTNTSSSVLTHTPIFGSPEVLGTKRLEKLLPGGTKGAGSGGQDGSFSRESILKSGLDYLIRVVNISGGIQPVGITLEWYEPT